MLLIRDWPFRTFCSCGSSRNSFCLDINQYHILYILYISRLFFFRHHKMTYIWKCNHFYKTGQCLVLCGIANRTINECGAVGGIKIYRKNWSIQRKTIPVPLCPPQILHELTGTKPSYCKGKLANNDTTYHIAPYCAAFILSLPGQ
jgi:hypothetical protein